ncbi:efflux RND transporter periplasmic adaptor subunit [Desertivirga xinjiangensis]|uniref:efflux RND transporter periplasmic adaptor subunit n=1 Tax=Desertivirga xinjiangensis TaxID=539206 RepID=UPI00210AF2E2|nr:efflux RND transporter periplasmic adaptor subunit [Pedobacter xinjiangensis]
MKAIQKLTIPLVSAAALSAAFFLQSCSSSSAESAGAAPPPPELPVIALNAEPVTIFSEYNASVTGKRDIEIRPKVDGYLEEIFVDEGAFARKGQPLFRIDSRNYRTQLSTALAQLESAKAALENASIDVAKVAPLVQNNVVSEVKLRSAKAAYNVAKGSVAQAQAQVQEARNNLNYTTITAPADGYIGSIPFKTGSLISSASVQPLTVLSETREVHAHFTMSEVDFIDFKNQATGVTLAEKLKRLPEIELVLPDNTIYPTKGRVELVEGQFGKTTGTINFRASFPNPDGLLRSGSTGKIRIPKIINNAILVPQEATFELQDKVFVYAVGDSSKVAGKALTIMGTKGDFYLVSKGVSPGDKIVFSGIDRLTEGTVIKSKVIPASKLSAQIE